MTTESPNLPKTVMRLLFAAFGLCFATVIVGKLTLIGPAKTVDERLYDGLARTLQSVPGLVEFAEIATRLGAIPVNYGMAIGAGSLIGLQRRTILVPALVLATLFGSHVFQEIVKSFVDGTIPPERYIVGSAGPFFSGGVQRVIVVSGIVMTLAQRHSDQGRNQTNDLVSTRVVYRVAAAVGLFEAFTRMVLGLHWPLDLLTAFPIGLSIVWIFRAAHMVVATIEDQVPLVAGQSDKSASGL